MSEPVLPRRTFLARVAQALGALAVAVPGLPLLAHLLHPVLKPRRRVPAEVKLGYAFQFLDPEPRLASFTVTEQDGWATRQAQRSVWLMKTPTGYRAFSAICPHLGCAVSWEGPKKRFFCPCHDSAFDQAGSVLGGPSPRPLDDLSVEVRGGEVWLRYEEYRVGASTRRPA